MAGDLIISTREMAFHLVVNIVACGYLRARERGLYGEILNSQNEGCRQSSTTPKIKIKPVRILTILWFLEANRTEARRGRSIREGKMPRSPQIEKRPRTETTPRAAPVRSAK